MTTSQSCMQTVWQPRQTQILNSVRCRPIPFHLQHLPCTRTGAQHKSAVPAPGELSLGLLQLVQAISRDRISTLMLCIDLCLIYIALIWFSSWRHEYKSKVTPTRVRSYASFKLVRLRFLNSSLSWCKGSRFYQAQLSDSQEHKITTHCRMQPPAILLNNFLNLDFKRMNSWILPPRVRLSPWSIPVCNSQQFSLLDLHVGAELSFPCGMWGGKLVGTRSRLLQYDFLCVTILCWVICITVHKDIKTL